MAPLDPNDKSGPPGYGSQRFHILDHSCTYFIHFENLESATAAAQVVLITDSLVPIQGEPIFIVTWSGSDDAGGSGIKHYDIYVSENNGP